MFFFENIEEKDILQMNILFTSLHAQRSLEYINYFRHVKEQIFNYKIE